MVKSDTNRTYQYTTREFEATALMRFAVFPLRIISIHGIRSYTDADFAACAANRTISATWACRKQRLAMNSCMIAHASQKEEDAAREEWFATLDERRKAREEKEIRKRESEKFFREWWDLDKKEKKGS